MRIVTYYSKDAQPEARWMAYFEVKTKPSRMGNIVPDAANPDHEEITGGKPDLFGYLPLRFRGSTEEEAIQRADAHWATCLCDLSQKRENAAARAKRKAA